MSLVGTTVLYVSDSWKIYEAVITGIPENPEHGWTGELTVSLEFRDERGKLVRKERVLPAGDRYKRQVWKRKA